VRPYRDPFSALGAEPAHGVLEKRDNRAVPFTGLEAAYRGSQPRTTDLTNVTAVTSAARAG
jgi:hypothetical protein